MNKLVYVGFVVVVVVLAYVLFVIPSVDCENTSAAEMNIGGHFNLAMHIHPNLNIKVNGRGVSLPANIGLSSSYMRPIHTHDGTGKLHVEAPCPRVFTLGDFFSIWGKRFGPTGIFEFDTDSTTSITILVNGVPSTDYENTPLADRDNIEVIFG